MRGDVGSLVALFIYFKVTMGQIAIRCYSRAETLFIIFDLKVSVKYLINAIQFCNIRMSTVN